jgi:hypothetical protein
MPRDDDVVSGEEVNVPGVGPMTRKPDRKGTQLPGTTMYVDYRPDDQGPKGGEK